MYIINTVTVKINPSNYNHFSKYINDISIGELVDVNIDILNKGSHTIISVKCDECGKEKDIKYNQYQKNYKNGDYLCVSCKRKKNNKEKYGVENVFQLETTKKNIKETNISKYGVENVSQLEEIKKKKEETCMKKHGSKHHLQNKDILQKQKKTNLEKYGVDNVSKLDIVKSKKNAKHYDKDAKIRLEIENKRKKTNLEKYNVEYTLQNFDTKEKIKETCLKKYGVDNPSKNNTIKGKISSKNIETKNSKSFENIENLVNIDNINNNFELYCNHCKKNYIINRILYYKRNETNTCLCTNCNLVDSNISGKEIELLNFIKDNYDGEIITNSKRIIKPYELDIYLPEFKLAFEFNGLYWHSEIYKEKTYHKMKFDLCKDKNIQLIQIYEDEWLYNKEIVKSMILNKINKITNKIFARKCTIKELIDHKTPKEFLDKNHIQGSVGSTVKIGLYYNEEMVSLMTFIKRKDDYELNRFCNKINTNIIGGASKLLKYFMNNYTYENIISFSANDYSNGNLYNILGFNEEKHILPDYSYIIKDKRYHKFNFRKSKFDDIDNLTEREYMFNKKIYRIYDSGKIRWVL